MFNITSVENRNITADEWDHFTRSNIKRSAKEIDIARILRTDIDNLLQQSHNDLRNQYLKVNEAFYIRIEETKETKSKLEFKHYEVFKLYLTKLENSG